MKPTSKEFEEEAAILKCESYLITFLAPSACQSPKGAVKRETKCWCLSCAKYMVHWAGLMNNMQNEILHQWLQLL
eukprot:15353727-Ditylum_brightwellii.AAC.2